MIRIVLASLLCFSATTACSSRDEGGIASRPARPARSAAPARAPSFEEMLAAAPASPEELVRVAAALHDRQYKPPSTNLDQYRADLLADLGDRRIPLLAHFLTDVHLGTDAVWTMLFLDRDRAAPFLFASMPMSDGHVQGYTFDRFVYDIRSGESVCCLAEMYAAAVRSLEAGTWPDAQVAALYAIGLSGSPADFPLLERFFKTPPPPDYWNDDVNRAAGAALVRLGSERHIELLERELAAAVPATITSVQSNRLSAPIRQAAFTGDRRFLPLLCSRLDDPYPTDFSDFMPSMPARSAAEAIDLIVNRPEPIKANRDVDRAKAWCRPASGLASLVLRLAGRTRARAHLAVAGLGLGAFP